MAGFTKLWSEILTSSIWNESDKVRIVWITMLACMGPDYMVRASVGGLAHQARVSIEDCKKALDVLLSPDPDSRSSDFEGKRIEAVEGGFHILNGGKYREARSEDERRTYMANYMRDYRKKHAPQSGCVYCGGKSSGFDHIIPTSQGGSDEDDNKVPCCRTCNTSKKDFDLPKWFFESDTRMAKPDFKRAMENEKVRRVFDSQMSSRKLSVNNVSDPLNVVNDGKPPLAKAEAEAEADPFLKEGEESGTGKPVPPPAPPKKPNTGTAGQKITAVWNSFPKLPKIQNIGTSRLKALQARARDQFFVQNWEEGIKRVAESDFCTGKNERAWVATFDWFIRPDSLVRIMEGKYANRNGTGKPQTEGERDQKNTGFAPIKPKILE